MHGKHCKIRIGSIGRYRYTLHKCVMLPTTVPTPSFLSPSPSSLGSSHLRELERLRRFGFHTAEVFRAKRAMLAEFEEDWPKIISG